MEIEVEYGYQATVRRAGKGRPSKEGFRARRVVVVAEFAASDLPTVAVVRPTPGAAPVTVKAVAGVPFLPAPYAGDARDFLARKLRKGTFSRSAASEDRQGILEVVWDDGERVAAEVERAALDHALVDGIPWSRVDEPYLSVDAGTGKVSFVDGAANTSGSHLASCRFRLDEAESIPECLPGLFRSGRLPPDAPVVEFADGAALARRFDAEFSWDAADRVRRHMQDNLRFGDVGYFTAFAGMRDALDSPAWKDDPAALLDLAEDALALHVPDREASPPAYVPQAVIDEVALARKRAALSADDVAALTA